DWTELGKEPHSTLLETYRRLIALRREHPELSNPWLDEVDMTIDEGARTVVLHRGGTRLVVNLGPDPVTIQLDGHIGEILLASEPVQGEEDAIALPPEAFAIVVLAA
ncbi:MAG: DUF3459 domain-containing protein, partial [Actinomycetes bacterium]